MERSSAQKRAEKAYDQRNKEQRRVKRQERTEQKRRQLEQEISNYYSASSIKVLFTLKEYTEFSPQTKKRWLNLAAMLKELSQGISSIEEIMKLAQVAENLIRDYWKTAKSEERKKSQSWNSLDYDEQQRLIRYWGYEKVRLENKYIDEVERWERQSQTYLKDIELAKFHEEKGKINCDCGNCQELKKAQEKIKESFGKIYSEPAQKKIKCGECKKLVSIKQWDQEADVCKSCAKEFG